MSVLKYFKNIPRSPPIGRQALIVIFFFKFATRSLTKKKGPVAPPTGDRGLSPVGGTTGPLALAAICRHSLCHLSLKIQEKSWSACRVVTSFLKWWKSTAIGLSSFVTYVWAKNATFEKPVIAVLSSGNL